MKSFLITCSHATCAIPEPQRELFKGSEELVTSIKGWEPGSLNLAQGLAMKLSSPLIHGEVSRLLIDLEETGEKQWSKISNKLPEVTRQKLIDRHEGKFRHAIETKILEDLKRHESIVHLMIHTAPLADGKILLEHGNTTFAKEFATKTTSKLPKTGIDINSTPIAQKTPLIAWVEETCGREKYDFIRITVSQSFFLKSLPMRWETIKQELIRAIAGSI